jgi:hypothetical protein
MALTDLPGTFVVPTRPEIFARWLSDYKLRQPGADVGAGGQPYIDGQVVTDLVLPIYADAAAAGNNVTLENKTSAGLEIEAVNLGLPARLPPGGSTGFVLANASVGGGLVLQGAEIRHAATGLRFQCLVTAVYADQQPVPIQGLDTGPSTNLAASTVLKWTTPPAGIGPSATVVADANGKGLTGGRDQETDPEIILRIQDARANPAAAGNSAAVRRFAKDGAKALGIPIQEVFVYSTTAGPGSTAFCFTVRPGTPGASRAPSNVQIAQILAFLIGPLPFDDGLFACSILETGVVLQLKVQWAHGATGWADASPWPPLGTAVSAVTDALNFSVASSIAPQVGQSFAFYDTANGAFVRKRVLTVTGAGPYAIVCDSTNGASDTSYTPTVGELPCPWSDSLSVLVQPLLTQFGALGPGEMVTSFLEPGLRQRRDPPSPDLWPSTLRNKDLELALGIIPQVSDVTVYSPTLPNATTVGTPNVSVNLQVVSKILAFPL